MAILLAAFWVLFLHHFVVPPFLLLLQVFSQTLFLLDQGWSLHLDRLELLDLCGQLGLLIQQP